MGGIPLDVDELRCIVCDVNRVEIRRRRMKDVTKPKSITLERWDELCQAAWAVRKDEGEEAVKIYNDFIGEEEIGFIVDGLPIHGQWENWTDDGNVTKNTFSLGGPLNYLVAVGEFTRELLDKYGVDLICMNYGQVWLVVEEKDFDMKSPLAKGSLEECFPTFRTLSLEYFKDGMEELNRIYSTYPTDPMLEEIDAIKRRLGKKSKE